MFFWQEGQGIWPHLHWIPALGLLSGRGIQSRSSWLRKSVFQMMSCVRGIRLSRNGTPKPNFSTLARTAVLHMRCSRIRKVSQQKHFPGKLGAWQWPRAAASCCLLDGSRPFRAVLLHYHQWGWQIWWQPLSVAQTAVARHLMCSDRQELYQH